MILSRRPILPANLRLESAACLSCQWRSFSTSYRRLAEKDNPAAADSQDGPPPPPSALEGAPKAYGKTVEEFTPKPLNRPIGLPTPPRAGQNTGIDYRSWSQRRADFVDYEKHVARRKDLTHKISKPYFREWTNMRLHKGKSFLAPPRLFRSDKSLYFPNFHGQTLTKDKKLIDTTPVLAGKVSVVSIFSSAWAEGQAATFVSVQDNPELNQAVKSSGGAAQLVKINIEDNWLKAAIVRFFMGGLRKKLGFDNWGRYFLVVRGVTDDMRDSIGLLNSKVGYTYLLDEQCRIRWAGSGRAEAGEKESLVKGVRRLLEDKKQVAAPAQKVEPQKVEDQKAPVAV
ncbi:ATPase complex subunit ATP10 [Hyphodiscus hymeniophilus]|uniref:ATPase complex subunit ATP10 n=1 Tax=Hyphodiscus hymeniophilus TaxID=353542 RepID=A0A9P6VL03_9HELO|nr:ATPase complex subunit ATP10 [Hyphodiscus hymeniophilus]